MFILLLLSLSFSVLAETNEYIHSVGASINRVSSDSELQDLNQKNVLTFKPNVSSGTGIHIETKYIGLSYTFAGGGSADAEDKEKSKFQDFRAGFHYGHFDFRLHYQHYQGALVNENGREEFYSAYEVKSKNARAHYYFNDDHLNYIRDGKMLVDRLIAGKGSQYSQSWFLGLNIDSRSIELPKNLVPEHQQRIIDRGINYDSYFKAFSAGPLLGYDGIYQYDSIFMRGKIAAGPAFQNNGGTVTQMELGFNVGVAFKQHHLISLGVDLYSISFKDSDQRINNSNVFSSFGYTYAFN